MLRAIMQLEQNKWKGQTFDGPKIAPVFICGLARSGSTLLLNRLAATGVFSTSTYRHMPFVLAPNMWSGAAKSQQKRAHDVERAHGDGMTHSFDSEEAFEEVFWRAILPRDKTRKMLPWNLRIGGEDMRQFRLFMVSVVKAGTAARYLSKNNNNVTRIPTILKSTRSARVVIPFRDPLGFAASTLAQHRQFLARDSESRFDAEYMAWLGHHEFGPNFLPFAAPGVVPPDAVDLNYLVKYWSAVNAALLENDDPRVAFFDYEGFCAAPEKKMRALGKWLEVSPPPTPPEPVHPPREYDVGGVDPALLAMAKTVHGALKSRAI